MSDPNPLFIDFNGVISYQRFWNSTYDVNHELYSKREIINNYLFIDNHSYVKEWMVGLHTSEDVHKKIEKDLGIDSNYLFNIFKTDCSKLDVSKRILSTLQTLKKKYKVILITDNMDSLTRFTIPNSPEIIETFDGMYISYHTGRLKKDDGGSIFKDICNIYKSRVEDCILIDDSNRNCELFEKIGGKGYCVTGEKEVVKRLEYLQ